jgi:hypothetical protein
MTGASQKILKIAISYHPTIRSTGGFRYLTCFAMTTDEVGKLSSLQVMDAHSKSTSFVLGGRWNEIDIPPDHLAPIRNMF